MDPPIPPHFTIGYVREDGNSFYSSIAQCINQLRPSSHCDVQSLKQKCGHCVGHESLEEDSRLKDVTTEGTEAIDRRVEDTKDFQSDGNSSQEGPTLGRPEVEGRIICQLFNVSIHVIEKIIGNLKTCNKDHIDMINSIKLPKSISKQSIPDQESMLKEPLHQLEVTWQHLIVDASGSKFSDNVDYRDDGTVHVIHYGQNTFKPVLKKVSYYNNNKDLEGNDAKHLSESSDEDRAASLTRRLITVVRSKKPEILKLTKMEELLFNGANINFRDGNGNNNTVLHVAIRKREPKVIEFLVRCNANVHLKNRKNISPLEYAEQLQIPFSIDMLKGNNDYFLEQSDESQMTANERLIRLRRREQQYYHSLNDRELEELTSKPKFKKLSDDSGASGHRFEINLLTLFKLRGENLTKGFYLAGNLEEAGAFDDVVFRYWNQNDKAHIIFFQAKHRQEPRQRLISWETFRTDKDFALMKYFASYLEIKEKFREQRTDLIFRGEFEQMNCSFVIYTNACLDEDKTRGLVLLDDDATTAFPIGKGGYAMKIQSYIGLEYLMEYEMKEYAALLAKKFIQFVTAENNSDHMVREEIVKEYHVYWARSVLEVDKNLICEQIKKGKSVQERKFRIARFRQEFLQNASDDRLTDTFRIEVLKEIEKRKLNEKVIKVTEDFGNISDRFNLVYPIENVCRLFVDLLNECEKSENKVVITKIPNKKLLKDLSKLIGIVFVENSNNRHLRLNDRKMEGEAEVASNNMKWALSNAGHHTQMDFDFQIRGFPKLLLKHSSKNEANMKYFLNRLTIFTDQPSAKGLDETIKRELKNFYELTDEEVYHSFLRINHKMTRWWQKTGSVEFLRKGDGFFSGIVRNGMHFRLRYPVRSFTGRVKELKSLHKSLQTDKVTGMSPMVIICGLGGMGKSELARKYASEYRDRYDHNVIWIDAENSSTIRHSFRTLCQTVLNIPVQGTDGRQRKMSAIIKDIYRFFGQRKSLFVFDNAESFSNEKIKVKNEIEIFSLQSCASNRFNPCIIVTSRSSNWPNKTKVQMDAFSDSESEEFVKLFLAIEDDSQNDDVKSLSSLLQNFPLALQQAVAFIRQEDIDCTIFNPQNSFRIGDYLKLYEKKSMEMLNFKFPEDSLDSYTTTTLKTWNITIEKLKKLRFGEEATKIMNMMAYFNPNNIPVEIFLGIVGYKETTLKRTLILLKQYSLISLRQGLADIHRLVQSVTRINLSNGQKEKLILRDALSLIANTENRKHMTQGVSIWNYTVNYSDLVTEFSPIPSHIINALIEAVQYKEAKTFAEASAKLLESLLGPGNQSTLCTNEHYGSALIKTGKYQDALTCYKDLNDERVRALGSDHEDSLRSQNCVAFAMSKLGNYEEALTIYRDVLDRTLLILGPDHPTTVSTRHTIGLTLADQGKDALSYLEEVLDKEIQILGPDHPDTLKTKHNIAFALSKKGKHEEALRYYDEVLGSETKILGPDHPETLKTCHNKAATLCRQGKYEEALRAFEEVLEKNKKILGPDHPDTIGTRHMIGLTLSNQGKDEALSYLRNVLEQEELILGPDHPDTLKTKHNIGQALRNQGHHEEALRTLQEVLAGEKKALGPEHPDVLITEQSIAYTLSDQGKYEEALITFRDLSERQIETLGPHHADTLFTQYDIAESLSLLGKYDEALSCYREVFEKVNKTLGPDHPDTLMTQHGLAQTLADVGEYEEALNCFETVLWKRTEILGPDHPDTLLTQQEIAVIHKELGSTPS